MTELFKCRKSGTQCCAPKSLIRELVEQKNGGGNSGSSPSRNDSIAAQYQPHYPSQGKLQCSFTRNPCLFQVPDLSSGVTTIELSQKPYIFNSSSCLNCFKTSFWGYNSNNLQNYASDRLESQCQAKRGWALIQKPFQGAINLVSLWICQRKDSGHLPFQNSTSEPSTCFNIQCIDKNGIHCFKNSYSYLYISLAAYIFCPAMVFRTLCWTKPLRSYFVYHCLPSLIQSVSVRFLVLTVGIF